MKKVILDLDGTLTKKDTLVSFSFFWLKNRPIFLFKFLVLYFLLRFKCISNIEFKNFYTKFIIKGKNEEEIRNTVNIWFEKIGKNLIRQDLFSEIANAEDIRILSANFEFIVEKYASYIKAKDFIAISLAKEGEVYNGKIEGVIPYGKNKLDLAKNRWGEKFIKESISYGDHISDKYILEFAKKSIWIK